MMGWHFHWVFAPIILLFGILIGVVVAPSGSTAAPASVTVAAVPEVVVEPVSDTAPYATNPDGPIGEIEDAASEGSMYRAQIPVETAPPSTADAQLAAFQRKNYDDCVAANLIGDRCRQIFYPEGPAEEAQAAQWRREAAPQVEANIRFLSEYNERQIRENSRYQ